MQFRSIQESASKCSVGNLGRRGLGGEAEIDSRELVLVVKPLFSAGIPTVETLGYLIPGCCKGQCDPPYFRA